MLNDRGTIKWTSLMLPEHVKMIRQHFLEEEYQIRPAIDEQQQELLNEKINESLEFGSQVAVTFFENHKINSLKCTIHYVDTLKKRLHLVEQQGQPRYLDLENLLDIQ